MSILSGKNILVGISAGIAAYKSAHLVRGFIKAGANVKVVMTPASKDFITPLTLSTLSKILFYHLLPIWKPMVKTIILCGIIM